MEKYNLATNNGICPLCSFKIKKEYGRWWHFKRKKGAECNDFKLNEVMSMEILVVANGRDR